MLARNSPTVTANTTSHPVRAARRRRPPRLEDVRESVLPANSTGLLCSGPTLTCTFQPALATCHDDRRRRTCHLALDESAAPPVRQGIPALLLLGSPSHRTFR